MKEFIKDSLHWFGDNWVWVVPTIVVLGFIGHYLEKHEKAKAEEKKSGWPTTKRQWVGVALIGVAMYSMMEAFEIKSKGFAFLFWWATVLAVFVMVTDANKKDDDEESEEED